MQLLSLRFLAETLMAIVLSVALYTLGWSVAAEPMLRSAAAPLTTLYVEDPMALLRVQFHVGLVCATPPLFAWLASLVYRVRSRAHPSLLRLVTSLAVPSVAVGLGFLNHLFLLGQSRVDVDSSLPMAPMIGVSALSPAPSGLRFALVAGVVVLLMNARRVAQTRGR